MGMSFRFAVVPFDHNGSTFDLYKREDCQELREGVLILETSDHIGFNISGFDILDEMTQGVFNQLCDGTGNWRYLLLEPRKQQLSSLREMLPSIPENENWQRRLKRSLSCLLDNADACLATYGAKAAMLIY